MRIVKALLVIFLSMPISGFCSDLSYTLDVRIEPDQQTIIGTARLTSPIDQELVLDIQNLKNLTVAPDSVVTQSRKTLIIRMTQGVETAISFHTVAHDRPGVFVDPEHIFLTGNWYPLPELPAEYHLFVGLPKNFIAVSEADVIHREETGTRSLHAFQFHHPVDAVHLAASSRFLLRRDYYRGIEIEACFFKEDIELADTYIQHAAAYLRQYEEQLTHYPYQRFAIVENIFPTGISFPTFTLLGKDVVRLPFIVKTSLGHEILHQWFGNAVYVDRSSGNWAEGLTTYLADHQAAASSGRDRDYRKQIMVDYAAYIQPGNVIPLKDFQYRRNKPESVIGYGKAAMFFHAIQNHMGKARFNESLKDFIQQHLFKTASWKDLQDAFESKLGSSLQNTFDVWLNAVDIPKFDVSNPQLIVRQGVLNLSFEIQHAPDSLLGAIPITVYTDKASDLKHIHLASGKNKINIPLETIPTKVVLDEQYHVMRHLNEAETPPAMASVLGSASLTAFIPLHQRSVYQPIIDALNIPETRLLTPGEARLSDLHGGPLLIAGSDSDLAKTLLGEVGTPSAGVRLRVFKHPVDVKQRILLVDAVHRAETAAIQHKLRHYGQYADISFSQGRNTHKETFRSQSGIELFEQAPPTAIDTNQVLTLEDILPELLKHRAVLIGEQHHRFAHHFNQLRVIEQFHENGLAFGVGMEMFKKPYQDVIDDYLSGTIDEQTFLKQTHYFREWGFDYHLYKPIVDFIKKNHIPLIALNLKEKITRQVARSGIESLDPADKNQIPRVLDFSNKQYAHDLKEVFAMHDDQDALEDFVYFHQAQVLWDEAMADTAALFLNKNPDLGLIILAGNGHLRNRYGIPDRLFRRTRIPSIVLLQDEPLENGIADYVLQTRHLAGTRTPKLGVTIEENEIGVVLKQVADKSPAQKAGLKRGDRMARLNDQEIKSLEDLRLALYTTKLENTYAVEIERNGILHKKNIQLFDFSHLPISHTK